MVSVASLRPSARKVCLVTLLETARGEHVQRALTRALESIPLSVENKRQATDLVYCSLRAKTRCLYVLGRVFPRFRDFTPAVRNLLVCACAALLFQDGAPAYAVINETVEDVRFLAGKKVAGAANGGLRALQRLGDAPMHMDFYREPGDGDDFAAFCRFTSFPLSLGRTLVRECGMEKTRRIMEASFARSVPCVRINPGRPGWEVLREQLLGLGGAALPGRAGRTGVAFPNGVPREISLNTLAGEGKLTLQAAGSQMVLAAFELDAAAPVWDVCCGFGGKTTALLEAGLNVALASDLSWPRLASLPGECARLGLRAPYAVLCDGASPPLTRFDGTVLLDVPCSGLGVLARRPDIKLRNRTPDTYLKAQRALLKRALLLTPRGRDVIYMTCTVTRSENRELVRAVCSSFDLVPAEEWETPEDTPYEFMYAARIRV